MTRIRAGNLQGSVAPSDDDEFFKPEAHKIGKSAEFVDLLDPDALFEVKF